MADQFQIMSIIAAAIRTCHPGSTEPRTGEPISTEDANCIAKAVLTALAEAGLKIAPTHEE
jgi:hypothetical protein